MQFVGAGDYAPGTTLHPQSPGTYPQSLGPKQHQPPAIELVAPPGVPQGMQYAPMPMYQPYQGQPNPQGYFPMMYYSGNGGQWPGGYMQPTYVPVVDNATYYAVDPHGNYILLPQQPNHQNAPPAVEVGQNGIVNGARLDMQYYENAPPVSNVEAEVEGKQTGGNFNDSRVRRTSMNTSLHRKNQKTRSNAVYKTLMCTMFEEFGRCTYGLHCQYAHGPEELRPNIPHPKYKTQMCNKFSTPRGCQYGDKCHFRHPDDPTPEFAQSQVQQRSGSFYESVPTTPSTTQPRKGRPNKSHFTPSNQKSQQSTNSKKGSFNNAKAHPLSTSSLSDKKELQKKDKDCLIKLSMYQHFENYVGKNRKPATLTRSNSCSTVGNFTFVRFVSMQKMVNEQISRLRSKKNSIALGKRDSLTTSRTPRTPLMACPK